MRSADRHASRYCAVVMTADQRGRFFGAGFGGLGGGAGVYSSITLLTTAIGRPACEYVALPSVRSTVSFSPRRLTCGSPSGIAIVTDSTRSEEHTSELQSHSDLVCRLLLEKKKHYRRRNWRGAD